MKVTFTKTHAKGYSVAVEGPGLIPSIMDPAPGYDERLPHDAAHFIVENELGIKGGVFGQLASRGSFRTAQTADAKARKKARRAAVTLAKDNKTEALFSEHAIYAVQSRWEKHDIIPDTKISPSDIARLCEKFDAFADQWSRLPVGGSMVMEWKHKPAARKR